jgi:hypothetical protein
MGRGLGSTMTWLVVIAAPLVPLAACAVNSDPVDVGDGYPEAGAQPSFTPPDADAGRPDVSVPPVNLCMATECPAPFATCNTSQYKCDVDFASDSKNCGSCGNVCPNYDPIHMSTQCTNGVCVGHCASDVKDCNSLPDDGCETVIAADPNNCGDCGIKCADGIPCLKGICGCTAPKVLCNGQCIDVTANIQNCGACGNECDDTGLPTPPPNMGYSCGDSTCGKMGCQDGWGDCDLDVATQGYASDGCEIPLNTTSDCGDCGVKCTDDQLCQRGSEGKYQCLCAPGQTLCANGCVDILSDPLNCGGCALACPGGSVSGFSIHASASCNSGVCGVTCDSGWADCDGHIENGCETDTTRDPANCGGCGTACNSSAGQPCVNGACLTKPCDDHGTTQ